MDILNLYLLFLFVILVVIAIAVIRLHSLIAIVMLSGSYSLVSALIFVIMDAVDVAFTEAAVGAGIATILMLATLSLTGRSKSTARPRVLLPLLVVCFTGAALIYGTLDMPHFGSPDAPIHHHVAPRYIEDSKRETGVPNMVTAVLASYRGYDTLGEITVIFTAGIAVMLLLMNSRRKRQREEADDD